VSVALVLLGGIALLPWMLGLLFRHQSAWVRQRPVWLLAFERAHRMRDSAAVAVSGVVAALSLAVALTVMVASFRNSVNQWLDTVLPADLYVRTAGNLASTETAYFTPEFVRAAAHVQGVQRLAEQRTRALQFAADKPPVTLIARTLHSPGSAADAVSLPLVGNALAVPAGHIGVYVSEAMVDLYGARPGTTMPKLRQLLVSNEPAQTTAPAPFFVAGVWRDYARQFGTVAMDLGTYQRLSQDTRINDIAFWLMPGAASADVQAALRGIVDGEAGRQLEFGTASQIRATTLVIFDRSFAVTYWLQAVAIGIGLFGVAASFSAQVLARRKEFGLLAHLGLTRRQVLQVVALEGATWTALGSLAGLGLGLAVAVVLVEVVNPQSFHWTMDLAIPWGRLLLLCAAVVVAGTVTAWLSGRAAASQDAVLAVKEDW
jgi:putative ABC transport system permease protein